MLDLTGLDDWQLKDVEELAKLHTGADARGLAQMIADDESFEEITVEKVGPWTEGEVQAIEWDNGWCTGVQGPEVKVGDAVRLYGRFGGPRHGWALNGEVVEWKTPWERYAERIEMLAEHDRRRREHYDEAKPKLEAWIAELRGPYRDRIDRFRAEREDFDVESGTYEVYPVLMAQRIEAWVRENDSSVDAFKALSYDEQKPILHAGQPDDYGISGHQFEAACGLARAVVEGVAV